MLYCKRCGSIHKKLFSDQSGIFEFKVSNFSEKSEIDRLKRVGNTKANLIWEATLSKEGKPQPNAKNNAMKEFIQQKYGEKKFCEISEEGKQKKNEKENGNEKEEEKEKEKKNENVNENENVNVNKNEKENENEIEEEKKIPQNIIKSANVNYEIKPGSFKKKWIVLDEDSIFIFEKKNLKQLVKSFHLKQMSSKVEKVSKVFLLQVSKNENKMMVCKDKQKVLIEWSNAINEVIKKINQN